MSGVVTTVQAQFDRRSPYILTLFSGALTDAGAAE